MYLKLQTGKRDAQMQEINEIVRSIFKYLAAELNFRKSTFKRFLGKDGKWLVNYYEEHKEFEKLLKDLAEEPLENRLEIYDALEHDMKFDQCIEDSTFHFMQRSLRPGQLEKVKHLTMYLYRNLFQKGFHLKSGDIITFQKFRDDLFVNNSPRVCPACLGLQEDLKKNGEVDHYFPKAKYPGLILHPRNLASICGECNARGIKGEKDPFENGNLTELYIPYLRYAENETGLVVAGDGGKRSVEMIPAVSAQQTEKRVENLDRLFHLKERWIKRMSAGCSRL